MPDVATASKSVAPDPLIGRVIADRFKIRSLIARGGMGKVYLAEQAPLGRLCAVKVLNANYTGEGDPEFHQRFFREARITSQITHPNSVTIFDYGKTEDDVLYMAMEYLEGRTLYQALREGGPMPEDRVGRIAAQICRALREAHGLGVVHRDLKPANIFLTNHREVSGDDDFVKVLDFGLVKHLSERPEEQLTQTGLFMGSPKYMAPEQIQAGQVDARTDIYSLGIILYEMLAGKVPFERPTSVNILMAHVAEPPPPMREVNPKLVCSPVFEDLVMRCISKDPAQRFASMDEVLYAIRLAHGGSMTGQLGSLSAAQAGALVAAGRTGNPPSMRAAASASHTPGPLLGMNAPEPSSAHGRSVSKWWIALAVAAAPAIGGGLGMLAFRLTSQVRAPVVVASPPAVVTKASGVASSTTQDLVPPAPSDHVPSSAPTSVATVSERPAAPDVNDSGAVAVRRVSVVTDPSGATVTDGDIELCASTPCAVEVSEAGGAGRVLKFSKAGYHAETRTLRQEGELRVHLARSSSKATPASATHKAQAPAPASTPASSSAKTAPAAPSSPSPDAPSSPAGFKDTPY